MEDRITRLEEKFCFNEDLLETLNRMVYQQQQQIDVLSNELHRLRQQMQMAQPGEASPGLRDEIPPHY